MATSNVDSALHDLLKGYPKHLLVETSDNRARGFFTRTTKVTHGCPIYVRAGNSDVKLYRTNMSNYWGTHWVFSVKNRRQGYPNHIIFSSVSSDVLDPTTTKFQQANGTSSSPPVVKAFPKCVQFTGSGIYSVNNVFTMTEKSIGGAPVYVSAEDSELILDFGTLQDSEDCVWWIYKKKPSGQEHAYYQSEKSNHMDFRTDRFVVSNEGRFPPPSIVTHWEYYKPLEASEEKREVDQVSQYGWYSDYSDY